ncbi:sphingosine kinase 1 [Stylonychia lemnae]|uniref:Sphingosine kinase 1 n=1 Tax=Stylonychia lemnae TaxID=5949 RepID=A0A078ALL3_STYLE|nr:sphingosine kinase 1 [Stylonychia lemnae]|eukprot:CDW82761.1 sphingosine kinase 1 [Stylonychia lemnae]
MTKGMVTLSRYGLFKKRGKYRVAYVETKSQCREKQIGSKNQSLADQLSARMQCLCLGISYENSMPNKRQILVIMNPRSGKGLAQQDWQKALPVLSKGHLDVHLVETKYFKHAYEIVSEIKPGQYDGIVTVSGDGLIHEAVNGIFQNKEKDQILDQGLSFGIIPSGTSNGFCKSITENIEEECNIEVASFLIARGRKRRIDLTEIETEYNSKKKIYMLLSLFWGFLADCDINSEFLRLLGPLRYSVWGIFRLIFIKHYPGSIYYQGRLYKNKSIERNDVQLQEPFQVKLPELKKDVVLKSASYDYQFENRIFSYVLIMNCPFMGETMRCAPLSSIQDGQNDIIVQEVNQGRLKLANQLIQNDYGSYFDSQGNIKSSLGIDYAKCTQWRIDPFNRTPESNKSEVTQIDCKYQSRFRDDRTAFFDIDGEKYPAQRIQARVLKRFLPVFS